MSWLRTLAALWLVGCADPDKSGAPVDILPAELEPLVLAMSPLPPVPASPSNAHADDSLAAALGHWLYFDPRLSGSGEFSCATCHDPEQGFGDGLVLSEAAGTTGRHAPQLWNVAQQRWFFWDGRCDSLWCQAAEPIEASHEMDLGRVELARVVSTEPDLNTAYTELFGAPPDVSDPLRFPTGARPLPDAPDDPDHVAWLGMDPADQDAVSAVLVNISKAIAAHERTLVTGPTAIDNFVEAVEDDDAGAADAALSPAARRGLELFAGEGNCVFCHSGPALSNLEFHNIGLAPPEWLDGLDSGRYEGIDKLYASEFNTAGRWSDDPDGDAAQRLDRIAQTSNQLAQFKVPGLRRVADSPPFFHGGHAESLEAVVAHYSEAAPYDGPGHREELMVPLDWSDDQIADMVAFLTEGLGGGAVDAALLVAPAAPLP